MKINESTLQSILNAQGRDARADKLNTKRPKPEMPHAKNVGDNRDDEELNIIRYDKEGKVSIDPKRKDALIDFFE